MTLLDRRMMTHESTVFTALGIDPSLSHTGLVVLRWRISQPAGYELLARVTVASEDDRPMYDRTCLLFNAVRRSIDSLLGLMPDVIVVEDPLDQQATAKFGRAPSSIARMGYGVGVVASALLVVADVPVFFVPASVWIPKTQTGRLPHAMKHAQAVQLLRQQMRLENPPQTGRPNDHEVMAAGVAQWWMQRERQRALARSRGMSAAQIELLYGLPVKKPRAGKRTAARLTAGAGKRRRPSK